MKLLRVLVVCITALVAGGAHPATGLDPRLFRRLTSRPGAKRAAWGRLGVNTHAG